MDLGPNKGMPEAPEQGDDTPLPSEIIRRFLASRGEDRKFGRGDVPAFEP